MNFIFKRYKIQMKYKNIWKDIKWVIREYILQLQRTHNRSSEYTDSLKQNHQALQSQP